MKICIDIRTLIDKQYSGIGIYTLNLLSNLFEIDKTNKYKLFYNSSNYRFIKKYYPNVEYYDFHIPNKIFNLFHFLFQIPKLDKLIGDFDIFFAPNLNFFSFSKNNKAKKIITIHDLSFEFFPDFYSKKSLFWHKMINPKKLLNKFDHIIAVSENTKKDIVNFYKINPDKISVTYLGIDEKQKPKINENKKGNNEREYLLYIGTIEPRKNIEGILQAFEDFCLENNIKNLDLIIAGKDGWNNKYIYEILKNSKIKDHIKILNYVTEKEKTELYKGAKIFLFPSFYEGFGIPIIEAQSFGVPIITSNNSSLSEIVENTAICINPYNTNEIKEAIKNLYFDNSLYKYYQDLSLQNAKKFTWLKTAENTLKIFEQISKDNI